MPTRPCRKEGNLTINAKVAKDVLKIEFTDTGVGISPENIGKILNRFSPPKPRASVWA
jgi:Signal transduction histidine kinase